MSKKGESRPGLFGSVNHYDEHGKKTGHSDPGLFGGYNHYDSNGHKTGHSDPTLFGGYNHYDAHGKKTGHSDPGLFGSYSHKDSSGKRTGSSDPNLLGGYSHSDSQGCYVATCVYGSYDCPQVWTLRRFRDNILAKTRPGRWFIYAYYAVSPGIVKWFGGTPWFRSMWRGVLNPIVAKLQQNGIEDTPYNDRDWRESNRLQHNIYGGETDGTDD
ncbi:MAG: hypothetical protein LUF78_07165 [Clostridiales bacterium]|nr:hypothetical protein [Clostridiales bacterium]